MRGLSPGTITGLRSGKVWSSTSLSTFPFSLTVLLTKLKATFNEPCIRTGFRYRNPVFLTYLCDNLDALVTSCILYISLCVTLQPLLSEG